MMDERTPVFEIEKEREARLEVLEQEWLEQQEERRLLELEHIAYMEGFNNRVNYKEM